ncbi:MAG: tRNA pseudouridine(55) synthase TruB [Actinomycetes bacterium]|jgi:tRNA pseudouridine55 synthase
MNGFLLIDKASGMTSHDVVAKMRKRFGTKRVGHAGTLDPMATGVLVLGVGSATRLLQYVTDGLKGYEATIELGRSTHTDDKEGDVTSQAAPEEIAGITDEQIAIVLDSFVGTIFQRPSSVSAIKIDGKSAHQRVREGEVVDLPEREVTITAIDIHAIRRTTSAIEIDISVTCSAGTYIRAIARDLGQRLGVGGHLTQLRRNLVSPFSLSECAPMAEAELFPVATGISRILPTRSVDFDELSEISFGRYLSPNEVAGIVAALGPDGEFVALLENKIISDQSLAAPILVAVK